MSPMVLPLAGVVIGACGTLLGQHLALRVDARREAAQRASEQRAERKDAIIGFLSATERVEQYRGQLALVPGHGQELIELMHAVWLAKKIIELVSSGTLAQAAHDYTRELNRASQELRQAADATSRSPGLSARERQLRAEFMEAARRELGYAGEPLLRRASADPDMSEPANPPTLRVEAAEESTSALVTTDNEDSVT